VLGIARVPLDALRGGDAVENAAIARAMLAGKTGPVRDAVLLNAAAAIAAYRGVDGPLEDALAAGLAEAAAAVDSGGAERVLQTWAETTTRLGTAG
jgi:anthranilate phosphoribosyltransferase